MYTLTSLLTWFDNLNKEIIHNILIEQPAFLPKSNFNFANQNQDRSIGLCYTSTWSLEHCQKIFAIIGDSYMLQHNYNYSQWGGGDSLTIGRRCWSGNLNYAPKGDLSGQAQALLDP